MAEFVEVVKQWRRMCPERGCDDCPLYADVPDGFCSMVDEELATKIEKTVMKWAAEHPEPVYPSWGEWLLDQGVLKAGTEYVDGFTYQCASDKLFSPIPAEVAEKLGIKPKER